MRLVGITQPTFFKGEADAITLLLEGGLDLLHIRKPGSLSEDIASLLLDIPSYLYPQIVIHDHFDLIDSFPLKGIHLNTRNPVRPLIYEGSVSRSSHSIEELSHIKNIDYCFLSPIFDSISKEGYSSAFSKEELVDASCKGIINSKVYALGGVTPKNIPLLQKLGFGGAAVLGYLWKNATLQTLQYRITVLKNSIH